MKRHALSTSSRIRQIWNPTTLSLRAIANCENSGKSSEFSEIDTGMGFSRQGSRRLNDSLFLRPSVAYLAVGFGLGTFGLWSPQETASDHERAYFMLPKIV